MAVKTGNVIFQHQVFILSKLSVNCLCRLCVTYDSLCKTLIFFQFVIDMFR